MGDASETVSVMVQTGRYARLVEDVVSAATDVDGSVDVVVLCRMFDGVGHVLPYSGLVSGFVPVGVVQLRFERVVVHVLFGGRDRVCVVVDGVRVVSLRFGLRCVGRGWCWWLRRWSGWFGRWVRCAWASGVRSALRRFASGAAGVGVGRMRRRLQFAVRVAGCEDVCPDSALPYRFGVALPVRMMYDA